MKIYLIIRVDDQDYSMSWTGNYAGYSVRFYGAYTDKEQADSIAENVNAEVYEYTMNQEYNELLGGCTYGEYDDDW